MKGAVTNELMMGSLSAMLNEGETLLYPVYGTILKWAGSSGVQSAFFGLTGSSLLFAALHPLDGSKILWAIRAEEPVVSCTVKKTFIPGTQKVKVTFEGGGKLLFQVSRKLIGGDFVNQAENVPALIEALTALAK